VLQCVLQGVLQCVAVCQMGRAMSEAHSPPVQICSVLQCVWQCVLHGVLQCVAACCSVSDGACYV